MNSERPIDNRTRARMRARRRRRNRRIVMIRRIILGTFIILVVLLGIFVYKKIRSMRIEDYYDAAAGYDRIIKHDKDISLLTAYAGDITVLEKNYTDGSEDGAVSEAESSDTAESETESTPAESTAEAESSAEASDGETSGTETSDAVAADNIPGEFTAGAGVVLKAGGGNRGWGYNAFEKLHPASTTKIMTALLAIKYADLTDTVTVTQDAMIDEPGASLAHIEVGDTYALRSLLYGLMLPSGNDAAAAIAIHISGSVEAFAQLMNEEAARLDCVDTHFVNPHGITDEDHYTTAYDLYLILNEANKYEEFREICQTKTYTAEYYDAQGNAQSRTWNNSNKYVKGERELPAGLTVLSGKTGTTLAAGNCLVLGTADEEGDNFVSVVLKAQTRPICYDNMDFLLQKIYN